MYQYRATVKRVIDGDTLEVDIDLGFKTILQGEKLRLLDIDTEELRSKEPDRRARAKAAKQYVESVLPPGTEITVHTQKDKAGKFGRYLAHVYFYDENQIEQNLSTRLHEQKFQKW